MRLIKVLLKCLLFYLMVESLFFLVEGGISFYLSQQDYTYNDFPVIYSIGHAVSAFVISIVVFYYFKVDFIQIKYLIIPSIRRILDFFYSFIISFLVFILIIYTSKHYHYISGSFLVSFNYSLIGLMIKLVVSSLIIGFSEELIYRGILTSYFLRNSGYILTFILIPILFSIGHVNYNTVISYLSAFVFGVLMTFFVLLSKSLYSAIGFHSGWNFSYFLFQRGFDYGSSINSINKIKFEYIQFGYLLFLLLIIMIYLIRSQTYKSFRIDFK